MWGVGRVAPSSSPTKRAKTEAGETWRVGRFTIKKDRIMKVLLVEPENGDREKHKKILSNSCPVLVHTEENGGSGVRLHQLGEKFKVTFLDLDVPNVIETTRAIQNTGTHKMIVGMVKPSNRNLARSFLAAGGNELLWLPVTANNVKRILLRAWREG